MELKIPCKIKKFKTKQKKTNLKKYGFEHALENSDVKNKAKATCLKKFGCDNVFGNKEIQERGRKTNLKKFGFEYAQQNKEVKERTVKTMIDKYGKDWFSHKPFYSLKSIIYLNAISEIIQLPIQHALNGGEKNFIRYWVDGYIEEYNICIEWDEYAHKYHKERDLLREQYLIKNFNCHIIRINEVEFLKDVDNQINIIVEKINNIIINSEIIHGT